MKEEIERQRHIQDSIYQVNRARFIEDSIRFVQDQQRREETLSQTEDVEVTEDALRDQYGVFTTVATGEEKIFTIENDVLKMTLSSKGAFVKTVELKDYKTWDSLPLIGFDENTTMFNISFFAANRNINTTDLYFTPYYKGEVYDGDNNLVVGDKPLIFSFRANVDDNTDVLNPDKYIEFTYTVLKDEYMVDFDVKTVNLRNVIASNTNFLTIDW